MARRATTWVHSGSTGTLGPGVSTTIEGAQPADLGGLTLVRLLVDTWWSSNSALAARTIAGPFTFGFAYYDFDIATGFPNVTDDTRVRWIVSHLGYMLEGLAGSASGAQHVRYDSGTMRKADERKRIHVTLHNGDGAITVRYGILYRALLKLP